jgi:hypothetical protein
VTQAALELLARWTAENAKAVPAERVKSEATRLAAEFAAYAKDAGFSAADLAELEEDIAETLESHMADALEAARTLRDDPSTGGAA